MDLVLLPIRRYQPAWILSEEFVMDVYRQAVICDGKVTPNSYKLILPALLPGHARLFFIWNVLHRNLNLENFMCYPSNDGSSWKAIVNDYDLAVLQDDETTHEAGSKRPTGTPPFMGMQLLDNMAPPEVRHIYAYELESWFYILLHIALGYTHLVPKEDLLRAWRSRSWDTIYKEKHHFIIDGFDPILDEIQKTCPDLHDFVDSLVTLFNSAVTDALSESSKLRIKKRAAQKSDKSDLAKSTGDPAGKSISQTRESDPAGATINPDKPDPWTTKNKYMQNNITLQTFGEIIEIPQKIIEDLLPHVASYMQSLQTQ